MAGEKPDVLLVGQRKPVLVGGLDPKVTLHYFLEAKDRDAFIKSVGDKIRAIAVAYTANKIDADFMQRDVRLQAGHQNWLSGADQQYIRLFARHLETPVKPMR